MTNTAHYRGDHTEALLAMSNEGHLFGPDHTGPYVLTRAEEAHAMRTGMYDMVRKHVAAGVLTVGARYEIKEAEFDPVTGLTTAQFRPHVDPRTRLRFHGGDGELDDQPTLIGRDDIEAG